jgi:hypothetical protein
MKIVGSIFLGMMLVSCTAVKKIETAPGISHIKFLGEKDLPHNLPFNNTTVGGLSGIDYDKQNNIYYLLSDDRSSINAARFYTARIFLNDKGIDSVVFISVHNLLQPDGRVYPNSKQDSFIHPTRSDPL